MTGSRRISVCFVVPSLEGGGAERVAVTVLNALDGQRYRSALYLFRRVGPYLGDVDARVELHAAPSDTRTARLRRLAAFIRQWKPDVVVSYLSYFSVFAAMRLARAPGAFVINQGTPLSAFLQDRDFLWRNPVRRAAFTQATRRVFPRADRVVVTSRGLCDDLVDHYGVSRERVSVIPNPFDLASIAAQAVEPLDAEWQGNDSLPLIVSAGRLAEVKNFALLVDALAILKRQMPFRALILGQGELEAALRRQISARGLSADVTLCGFQPNPWKFMARADVLALTSRYEGFGNVIVEAMACGTPTVATASPGTRDLIVDDVNGLLVERHDAGGVAAALGRVLQDRAMRDRLSRGARAHAERYGLPRVIAAYDRLFESLAA